jgi:Zn-finger nucleic acid-binding protein
MTCPKCRGAMSSYERSGVVIDQCTECRGIFLDRGELERFIDLANGEVARPQDPQWSTPPPDRTWRQQPPQQVGWHGGYQAGPQQGGYPGSQQGGRQDWDDDSDSHRGGGYHGSHGSRPPKKKRSSILGELLDF